MQAAKMIDVDTEMCDRFMEIYRKSELPLNEFYKACGLKSKRCISEIGRYVIEPSKKVMISLYDTLGVNPNYILIGVGPLVLDKKRWRGKP